MAAKKSKSKAKSSTTTAKRAGAGSSAAKKVKAGSAKAGALTLIASSPALTVNDVDTSLGWYRDVLGFTVAERWEHDGKLLGVGMSAGAVFLMLGQDDWKKGRNRIKGQGVRLYFETAQDIDRLATTIKARGGRLAAEPQDQPWGMRDIAIDDPDGYKITFAAKLKKKR